MSWCQNLKDYVIETGSINDLKNLVKLDKVVFGLSRTPEEVEGKLRLQKHTHKCC